MVDAVTRRLKGSTVHISGHNLRALVANFRVQPELVGRIMSLQKNDLQLVQLVDKVKKGGKSDFVLCGDEILRFGTRLCVSSDEDSRRELL